MISLDLRPTNRALHAEVLHPRIRRSLIVRPGDSPTVDSKHCTLETRAMMPEASHVQLYRSLLRALRSLQLRWWLRGLLRAVAGSLLAVCASYGLVLSGAVAGVSTANIGADARMELVALVFLLSLASWVGFAVIVAPSRIELARRLDRYEGGRERLSTAVEVGSVPKSAVERALLRDSSACARSIVAGRAFHVPLRGASFVTLATLSVTLAMHLSFDTVVSAGHETPDEVVESARDWLSDLPDDPQPGALREVAEAVSSDADARSDPHLRAVAQALEGLADSIESGEAPSDDVRGQLGRIMEHAEHVYGSQIQDVAEPLLAAARGIEGGIPPSEGANRQDEFSPDQATSSGGVGQSESAGVDTRDEDSADELGQRFATRQSDEVHPEFAVPEPPGSLQEGSVEQFEIPDQYLAPAGAGAEGDASLTADASVGGAEGGSADGASERAGAGGHELRSDANAGSLAWDPPEGDELRIDTGESGARRIRLDAAPGEDITNVSAARLAIGDWTRAGEASVTTESVGRDVRSVVSRYFEPERDSGGAVSR